jgi:hypothetical protein
MRGARDEEFDFSAVVGLNPCRAVSRPPPASAFGSGWNLSVIVSSHSRLDQFHGCVRFWAKCWRALGVAWPPLQMIAG